MVIHDFSTTISCDKCSDEFTVSGNLSEKAMRTLAKKDGWMVIDGKDICLHCVDSGVAKTPKSEVDV